MATILEDDVLKFTVKFQGGGGQASQNVYHYQAASGFNQTSAFTFALTRTNFIAAYNAINQFYPPKYIGSEIVMALYNAGTDTFTDIESDDFPVNGSGGGEEMINAAAGLIRFPLATGGRTGSKYLGGLIDGALDDQSLTQPFIDAIVLYALEIVEDLVFASGDLVPGIWSVKDLVFKDMTKDIIIKIIAAHQTRRKVGVGE